MLRESPEALGVLSSTPSSSPTSHLPLLTHTHPARPHSHPDTGHRQLILSNNLRCVGSLGLVGGGGIGIEEGSE